MRGTYSTEVKKERRIEVKIGPKTSQITFYNYPINQVMPVLSNLVKTNGETRVAEVETSQALEIDFRDLPSKEKIRDYIEAKGGTMIHGTNEIQEVFVGGRWSYPAQKYIANEFSKRHSEAREEIEQKYGGKFSSVQRTQKNGVVKKPYRLYEFSKNIGPPKSGAPSSDLKTDESTNEDV